PGGYAEAKGTSMAAPHVAATAALMWSAAPSLVGDVEGTRELLNQTAVTTEDLSCGGTPGSPRRSPGRGSRSGPRRRPARSSPAPWRSAHPRHRRAPDPAESARVRSG